MNSMTSAVPVANSVLVVAPHNGYPATPGIMSQVPLYPNNQPQVHLVPGNPPGLMSNVNRQPVQKTLKEGKTLGAIQIIIGLAHIGLGSIMGTVLVGDYLSISFYGGFPFWGGLWNPGLAISGVLLVFCLLEFGIACTSSHFGCQLVCCQSSNVSVMYPNVYAANPVVIPEPVTSPPSYSSEFQANK
ncbi:membrane-spanning 4-domains subfamily A member 8 isoform X3 [Macaca fascicularis]|uniref:membrane-spanning 4-domains subfamily A member 8 isoform X3 n=1 Tax=Macaca fascicularis TaxID=9541 RepID=UPI003D1583F5